MDWSNILVVAHYNAKLLRRNWIFRLFIVVVLSLIIAYLFYFLSTIFSSPGLIGKSASNRPDSFFPYITVYLFNILQVLPIIFLAGNFYDKKQKPDTMDAVYIRPMNNFEYIGGVALGMIRTFMYVGFIVLIIGAFINIFGTDGSFNAVLYLFFYFVLAFPTLVFFFGLSFLILGLIHNYALYIIVMLFITFISIFFANDIWQGALDPFGIALPGAFSEITGHSNLVDFLLQRFCWLLIGFGFLFFSVVLYKRLPNNPDNRKHQCIAAISLTLAGLFVGGVLLSRQVTDSEQRNIYAAIYNKYNDRERLILISQDIEYTQQGAQMDVISRLIVDNHNTHSIKEGLLYLNPNLKVLKIEENGQDISFTRDNQVIILQREFLPDLPVEFFIHYKGGINKNIAYLDVPNELIYDNSPNAMSYIYFGKKHAFLSSKYTLLLPDILWYPVTVPPVNPLVPFDLEHNFTHYRLTVNNVGDKTAISQGKRIKHNGNCIFENKNPLTGISLIIGEYTTSSIIIDSTEFELALFKRHGDLFKDFELIGDTISGSISTFKNMYEHSRGLKYQFDYLRLVETPLTFQSYFRSEHGKSETIQSEMVLLPELGQGLVSNIKGQKKHALSKNVEATELDTEINIFRGMLTSTFMSPGARIKTTHNALLNLFFPHNRSNFNLTVYNPYELSPLFLQYVTTFYDKEYPILNIVLAKLVRESSLGGGATASDPMSITNYLSEKSLKDAINDKNLKSDFLQDLIKLKATDLKNRLYIHGVDAGEIEAWMNQYVSEYYFQQIEFDEFNDDFKARFGIDLQTIIPEWYTVNRLPRFECTDIILKEVDEGLDNFTGRRYRIEFTIYNDSDVDGIISIQLRQSIIEKCFAIKGKEAKRIAFLTEKMPGMLSFNLNLSQNYPIILNPLLDLFMALRSNPIKTKDTTQFEKPILFNKLSLPKGEIIIDNEDSNFSIIDRGKRRMLTSKKIENKSKYGSRSEAFWNKSKWVHFLDEAAYGRFIKSAVIKIANNSSAYAEWKGETEKAGKYELFIHIPNSVTNQRAVIIGVGERNAQTTPADNEQFQYYTITHAGGNEQTSIDVGKKGGWISLGTFRLDSGTFQIRLLDKGKENQTLFADAVKLVCLGE